MTAQTVTLPLTVAGQKMGYTPEEYLRLSDEYVTDALIRLDGTTTIEQSIRLAQCFATMALAAATLSTSVQVTVEPPT